MKAELSPQVALQGSTAQRFRSTAISEALEAGRDRKN